MSELIISVSGLRGVVGETLTPEIAQSYAAAFAQQLGPGAIVIGRDGRTSGPMLAAAIAEALEKLGRTVVNAGVAATPTVGVLVRSQRAAGGIQISASHNPAQYNGLKLFSSEGRVLPAVAGQRVLEAFQNLKGGLPKASDEAAGSYVKLTDTTTEHWELIKRIVDVAAIRRRKFSVVLDANHGSGSVMGERLLTELGCRVTVLGAQPDGLFEHTPEPTAENLATVLPRVRELKADVGFCQDPDADRLALIDEKGRYVGEEYTLALAVDHELSRRPGPIVTNCSTSRMSEDLAQKYGVPFFRSAVGEANVVDRMLAERAVLGGEGNGGVIDPRVVLVRDSFVAMAMTLDCMAARDLPLSTLVDQLPRYAIVKTKMTIARDKIPAALAALEKQLDGQADRLDGLRLDWPRKWLLVRASNTEPIVRAIAEAPTESEAQALCDAAAAVLSGI